jgi:hypothetical protein
MYKAQTARNAIGSPVITSWAPIGASPGASGSEAANRAASPCRYAAAIAACGGSSPCASSEPASPDRTSPVPAVASQGVPVVLTNTGSSPSGGAITVVEPLSSTQAPNWVAASRACSSRRAVMSAGSLPSSRPSSPACGVSRVGAGRGSRSLRLASSDSPSASTSTGRLVASTAASLAAAASVVPIPGPATHACTRPTPWGNSVFSSERTRPSLSSSVITTSGHNPRTAAAAVGAVTSRTMPAPPRTAPPVESRAAPVNRSLPASSPRTPRRYLSDSMPGRGSSAAMSSRCGALTSGAPSRYGLSPMSTSSTTPA